MIQNQNLLGFFQKYFFGSDDVVDLGVRPADGYPGIMAMICKHIMKDEFFYWIE